VHIGHAAVISAAVSQKLQTAVVTFLHHPAELLLNRYVSEITCHEIKENVLESMGVDVIVYIDFEVVRDMSPAQFIDILFSWFDVKYISCGFNYHFGKGALAGVGELSKLCMERGIVSGCLKPVCINDMPVSSTRIRALVSKGDVKQVAALLGRPFAFYGEVIHGRHLGRTLGSPTINQQFPQRQLLPRFGVYASVVHLDGKSWPAVTNVGVKPTISQNEEAGAETYIPGFEGDLYRKLQVDIIEFLRPEQKFNGLDELRIQLTLDTVKALEIIGDLKAAIIN
jgi:riboflavin kinase/FMN adenylyltransferase